jgi:hypothetical protein
MTFHVLPSVVARALDKDPARTDLVALDMLEYSRALADHKSADKKAIEAWGDSAIMRAVQEYDAEMVRADLPSVEELRAAGYEIISDAARADP